MHQRIETIAILICVLISGTVFAHNGPDPVARWEFSQRQVQNSTLRAVTGPDLRIAGPIRFQPDPLGESMVFGPRTTCLLPADSSSGEGVRPRGSFTVSAWVAVDEAQKRRGFVGTIEDNGDTERGWLLGHNETVFTLILSTSGADDGDGCQRTMDPAGIRTQREAGEPRSQTDAG